MDFSEDDILLREHIDKLTQEKKLALAISISKIFYFDYQQYAVENELAGADLIIDIIQFCERSIGKPVDQTVIENHLSDLYPIMPDQDELDDEITYMAMCAWAVVVEVLELLLDKKPHHLYQVIHYYIFNKLDLIMEENDKPDDDPEAMRQNIFDMIK